MKGRFGWYETPEWSWGYREFDPEWGVEDSFPEYPWIDSEDWDEEEEPDWEFDPERALKLYWKAKLAQKRIEGGKTEHPFLRLAIARKALDPDFKFDEIAARKLFMLEELIEAAEEAGEAEEAEGEEKAEEKAEGPKGNCGKKPVK